MSVGGEQNSERSGPAEFQRIGEIVRRNLTGLPHGTAVTYGEREWDWTEFDARVRRVVTGLRSDRLQRGEHVAVLARNHPVMLEALFAAANMGLVLTVVDPALDRRHVVKALNESQARFLFLGREFEHLHEEIGIELDSVVTTLIVGGEEGEDEYEEWLETHETHEGMLRAAQEIAKHRLDDAVVRLYSASGRNGPTRAEHTHRTLLAACSEWIRRKAIQPGDVAVVDETLSRTAAVVRALGGMAAGGVTTLVCES